MGRLKKGLLGAALYAAIFLGIFIFIRASLSPPSFGAEGVRVTSGQYPADAAALWSADPVGAEAEHQ